MAGIDLNGLAVFALVGVLWLLFWAAVSQIPEDFEGHTYATGINTCFHNGKDPLGWEPERFREEAS